jgi:hypothetical protein
MTEHRKQSAHERRDHLQTLVLLGARIVQLRAQDELQRRFVVFSAVAP